MADDFATNGYFVVMPDILDKDPIIDFENLPEGFTIGGWLGQANHQTEFVQAVIDKTLAKIRVDFSTFEPKSS